MRIPIVIETHDRKLAFDIVGTGSLQRGATVDVPGGATLQYQGSIVRKALGIPEVLEFVVHATASLDLGLLAAWLYDKVKGKDVETITINRRIVTEITEEGIREVIEVEIHSSK